MLHFDNSGYSPVAQFPPQNVADPPRSMAGVERLIGEMYRVYVLKSLKNGKRYVGLTSKSVEERLRQHRSGSTQWTRQNGPFQLVHAESFPDQTAARRREKFLKSGHGREFLNSAIPR